MSPDIVQASNLIRAIWWHKLEEQPLKGLKIRAWSGITAALFCAYNALSCCSIEDKKVLLQIILCLPSDSIWYRNNAASEMKWHFWDLPGRLVLSALSQESPWTPTYRHMHANIFTPNLKKNADFGAELEQKLIVHVVSCDLWVW